MVTLGCDRADWTKVPPRPVLEESHSGIARKKARRGNGAMEQAYMKTSEEVLEYFKVSEEDGLTPERVETQREKYGLNGECLSAAGEGRVCVGGATDAV